MINNRRIFWEEWYNNGIYFINDKIDKDSKFYILMKNSAPRLASE